MSAESSIMAKVKNSATTNGTATVAATTNGKPKADDETNEITADSFDVTISRLNGGRWRVAIEGGAKHPTMSGEVLYVQTVRSLDGMGDTIDGLLADLMSDDEQ